MASKKRKIKYFDSRGTEIPEHDKDAMADIAEGRKIHYYDEKVDKSGTGKRSRI